MRTAFGGPVQPGVILGASQLLFELPMVCSLPMLLALIGACIDTKLAAGFTFSTFARIPLRVQLTFFLLASILLPDAQTQTQTQTQALQRYRQPPGRALAVVIAHHRIALTALHVRG